MIDVENLLHHIGQMPEVFLHEPRIGKVGSVDVAAVLGDLFSAIGADPPGPEDFGYEPNRPEHRNRQRVILVAAWIAWTLRSDITDARKLQDLFRAELTQLAAHVDAEQFANDPDRQEELVRTVLKALELQPAGETPAQTADRLDSLSTVRRTRIIRAQQKKLERARQLKADMERKRREAQASRYGRE